MPFGGGMNSWLLLQDQYYTVHRICRKHDEEYIHWMQGAGPPYNFAYAGTREVFNRRLDIHLGYGHGYHFCCEEIDCKTNGDCLDSHICNITSGSCIAL